VRLVRRRSGLASTRPTATVDHRVVERGGWGIAVLSRLPVLRTRTVELAPLPADPARRGAIAAEIAVPGSSRPLLLVGTHLAHISQGSPRHIVELRRALGLSGRSGDGGPGVVAGDMNMWGPPLTMFFPGWRRAVRGRTWPSWTRRPLVQSDHILVHGPVHVVSGCVGTSAGSDHLPVRAVIEIDDGAP
jgi:endonuclease/exonuclease/phosphatase family metal-dependent hydrolase